MKFKATIGLLVVLALLVALMLVWFSFSLRSATPPAAISDETPQAETTPSAVEEHQEVKPVEEEASSGAQPSVTIYGTVMDVLKGAPIPGARIQVSRREPPSSDGVGRRRGTFSEENLEGDAPVAAADENGAYTLIVEKPDEWKSIVSSAEGYAREFKPMPAVAETHSVRVDFLLRQGGMISGRVTDASTGAGISGITVQAAKSEGNVMEALAAERSITATDESGEFHFSGLPLAVYRVRVRAREKGYLFAPEQIRIVDLAAMPSAEHVDFVLQAGASVVGTVYDTKQQPLAKAEVSVMPGQLIQAAMRTFETMGPEDWMGLSTVSDENGHFEIKGLDFNTEYRLRGVADGYAEHLTDLFKIEQGASPKEMNLVLTRGSTVSGKAKYEDGAPAAKRTVTLMPELSAMMAGRMTGVKSTTTQEDGSFRFENVSDGQYTLQGGQMPAFFTGGQVPSTITLTVEAGKDIAGLELVLTRQPNEQSAPQAEGTINGTVLDPSGKPIGNVRVEARLSMNPMATSSATSKEDGTFTLTRLLSMPYDVTAASDAGTGRVENVMPGTTVTLRLVAPATVSGVVVDAAGDPVVGCRATLTKKDASDAMRQQAFLMGNMFGRGGASRTTDAVGFFEFRNVEPGRYVVEAKSDTAGTGTSQEFPVAAGQRVDNLRIVLDPGSEFSGVVETQRGEPVEGARVSLIAATEGLPGMMSMLAGTGIAGSAVGSATSDNTGAFRISRVPAGTYTVVATHSSYARFQAQGVQIVSGRDVTGYRIRLSRGGRAAGRLSSGGSPREGVMVQLVGPNGMYTATTDSTGAFSFDGIPPGRYMIQSFDMDSMMRAATGGFSFTPRVVDIPEDGSVDVDFGADQGVPVSGRINLNTDSPGMVVYSLRRPGGPAPESLNFFDLNQLMDAATYTVAQGMLGADGTFHLSGVEPGTYILDVYTLNFDPQRPDMNSMLNALQSPAIRHEIVVGNQPLELDLSLPGNASH